MEMSYQHQPCFTSGLDPLLCLPWDCIDRILNVRFQFLNTVRMSCIGDILQVPRQENVGGVKSRDRTGHNPLEISRPGKHFSR